jgi:hypothetical protein
VLVSHRPMERKDVRECAALIAKHPVIGPRYGSLIRDLPTAWMRLLCCEAKRTLIHQVADAPRAPICFVGVSIFVNDDFVRELKALPGFWIGPELVRRILRGDSPILTDRQLAEANAHGRLNLLIWEGCFSPEFHKGGEIYRQIINAFVEEHRGFSIKEVISSQLESAERLLWTLRTGGMLWNPVLGSYEEEFKRDPHEIIRHPHVVGMTRAQHDLGTTWVGGLFDYQPPRCGFSRSEQRMLLFALNGGGTDLELSQQLDVSVSTVKKMWLSVYRRMAERLPKLVLNHSQRDLPTSRRGTEKKRYHLAYLRKHPEELRPTVRRASDR